MQGWLTVFTTGNPQEAELVRGLLIAHDIEAIVVDEGPSPYPSLAEMQVLVIADQQLRARYIVNKHRPA